METNPIARMSKFMANQYKYIVNESSLKIALGQILASHAS
jgi:hypothetical protein